MKEIHVLSLELQEFKDFGASPSLNEHLFTLISLFYCLISLFSFICLLIMIACVGFMFSFASIMISE